MFSLSWRALPSDSREREREREVKCFRKGKPWHGRDCVLYGTLLQVTSAYGAHCFFRSQSQLGWQCGRQLPKSLPLFLFLSWIFLAMSLQKLEKNQACCFGLAKATFFRMGSQSTFNHPKERGFFCPMKLIRVSKRLRGLPLHATCGVSTSPPKWQALQNGASRESLRGESTELLKGGTLEEDEFANALANMLEED